jgi:hypothetical protein
LANYKPSPSRAERKLIDRSDQDGDEFSAPTITESPDSAGVREALDATYPPYESDATDGLTEIAPRPLVSGEFGVTDDDACMTLQDQPVSNLRPSGTEEIGFADTVIRAGHASPTDPQGFPRVIAQPLIAQSVIAQPVAPAAAPPLDAPSEPEPKDRRMLHLVLACIGALVIAFLFTRVILALSARAAVEKAEPIATPATPETSTAAPR